MRTRCGAKFAIPVPREPRDYALEQAQTSGKLTAECLRLWYDDLPTAGMNRKQRRAYYAKLRKA